MASIVGVHDPENRGQHRQAPVDGLEDDVESPGHHHVENGHGEETTNGEAKQPLSSRNISRCSWRVVGNNEFLENGKIDDPRQNGQH